VQLDRLPPRRSGADPGTPSPVSGVPEDDAFGRDEPELLPRLDPAGHPASAVGESDRPAESIELPGGHASRFRAWGLLLLACVSLLGQGERLRQDPRFRSPGAALETYWEALRANDVTTVAECFTEPEAAQPFPGMLWFLPPVDSLRVAEVRVVSATSGEIVAAYEVRFTPAGSARAQHFFTTSDLRRVGREWRIVPSPDGLSLPEWKPFPRPGYS
jgi:hypothetical protein